MYKRFLFLLLLASTTAFAQFTLEHTYSGLSPIRIKLDYSGEKYYIFKQEERKIDLYNSDHTFWKSVVLPIAADDYFQTLSSISDGMFNSDPDIEVVYTYSHNDGSNGYYKSEVFSESDGVLLSLSGAGGIRVDMTEGLLPKLVSSFQDGGAVYSIPSLLLEHTYSGYLFASASVSRIVLENSGEKYYVRDDFNNKLDFFNSDHSFWKSVNLPKQQFSMYNGGFVISETAFNSDAQLEIGYSYGDFELGHSISKVVSESGTVLFSLDYCNYLTWKPSAAPAKLFAYYSSATDSESRYVNVYSLPSLALEHTYPEQFQSVNLEFSGEKNYTFDRDHNQVVVYNLDHSIWKTVSLPVPETFHLFSIGNISEHAVNQDNQLEIAYTVQGDLSTDPFHYDSFVANENEEILLTVPRAYMLYLSKIDGLSNKLISVLSGPLQIEYNIAGGVYAIDNQLKIADFSRNQTVVYPNPVKDIIRIENTNATFVNADLYNSTGISVKSYKSKNINDIDVSNLSYGIYLLKLTADSGNITTHKIIIAK